MPIIHEVEGVDCEWTVNPSLVKNRDANCKSIKKQKTSLVKKTGSCRYHCFSFRKKSPLIGSKIHLFTHLHNKMRLFKEEKNFIFV